MTEKILPPNNKIGYNNMVATIKENRMGYMQKQFDNAKWACQLYHIVRASSITNFKLFL